MAYVSTTIILHRKKHEQYVLEAKCLKKEEAHRQELEAGAAQLCRYLAGDGQLSASEQLRALVVVKDQVILCEVGRPDLPIFCYICLKRRNVWRYPESNSPTA